MISISSSGRTLNVTASQMNSMKNLPPVRFCPIPSYLPVEICPWNIYLLCEISTSSPSFIIKRTRLLCFSHTFILNSLEIIWIIQVKFSDRLCLLSDTHAYMKWFERAGTCNTWCFYVVFILKYTYPTIVNFIIYYTYPTIDIYFNVKFLAHFNFTIYI